jgi:hypothetical protein
VSFDVEFAGEQPVLLYTVCPFHFCLHFVPLLFRRVERSTRFISPSIGVYYRNTLPAPDKTINGRTIIGCIHKTVTKNDFAFRHFFQRDCQLTVMYVRPAYKHTERKSRITDISMQFVPGPNWITPWLFFLQP